MKVIAVIPARYNSTRFPGKLMEILEDKTVISTTYKMLKKQVCLMMFCSYRFRDYL